MELRKESLVKYKDIFPMNASKSDFDLYLNHLTKINININTSKVFIYGKSVNYKMAFGGLLFNHFKNCTKLPTLDVINAHMLVSAYFGNDDDATFPYSNLSNINVDILALTIGFAEPNPKMALTQVQYQMHRAYTTNQTSWVYSKGFNKELEILARELGYTIINIDNFNAVNYIKPSYNKVTTNKPTNQTTTNYDLF